MLLGIHAPVQGWTQRAQQTAAALKVEMIVWLPAENPSDAKPYPDALHVVRLATPTRAEGFSPYIERVAATVRAWMSVPNVVFQVGNEPTLDGGWTLDGWLAQAHTLTTTFKAAFPGAKVVSTPLRVEETQNLTTDAVRDCDYCGVHSYWERDHVGDIANPGLGASWRTALRHGAPILVTEVNSVGGTEPSQIAAWLDTLTPEVAGVALFIADASPDWKAFDVSPEQAGIIRGLYDAMREKPPEKPITPPLPPTPPVAPLPAKDALWAALVAQTPIQRLREIMLMGAVIETGRTGPPFPDQYGGGPGRGPFQIEAGAGGSHYGRISEDDARDPARAVAYMVPSYAAAMREVDESDFATDARAAFAEVVYRAEKPAQRYPESRVRAAWETIAPYRAAAPVVVTPPTQARFAPPVDAPVMQDSDGPYSHAGVTPGFFAIDFDCPRGTPVRAIADGTVTHRYEGDRNPISNRTGPSLYIEHDDGYASFSCHLSRMDVAEGEAVRRGQIIGLSGDPRVDGGYGNIAHLHFEIWREGVRIRWEDVIARGDVGDLSAPPPTSPPVVVPRLDAGLLRWMWQYRNDVETGEPIAVNEQSGIYRAWVEAQLAGTSWGVVQTNEHENSGRILQMFSNGIAQATEQHDGSWTVTFN